MALVVLGAQFAPLLVFSNLGRVVGGTMGGWLAAEIVEK